MTSEGLEEMFEGDTADMCAGIFSLVSMGVFSKVVLGFRNFGYDF